jgi:hypothetical protein
VPGAWEAVKDLHEAYVSWCRSRGAAPAPGDGDSLFGERSSGAAADEADDGGPRFPSRTHTEGAPPVLWISIGSGVRLVRLVRLRPRAPAFSGA